MLNLALAVVGSSATVVPESCTVVVGSVRCAVEGEAWLVDLAAARIGTEGAVRVVVDVMLAGTGQYLEIVVEGPIVQVLGEGLERSGKRLSVLDTHMSVSDSDLLCLGFAARAQLQ